MFPVHPSQSELPLYFPDLSRRAFDFDEPTYIRNVIKANLTALQSILLPNFGICFVDAKIEQFKNAFGGFIFDRCFDLHARLVMRPQPWALKREHGDLSPVSAESKLETLVPETVTTVEEFVAFKAAGMGLSPEPH